VQAKQCELSNANLAVQPEQYDLSYASSSV